MASRVASVIVAVCSPSRRKAKPGAMEFEANVCDILFTYQIKIRIHDISSDANWITIAKPRVASLVLGTSKLGIRSIPIVAAATVVNEKLIHL